MINKELDTLLKQLRLPTFRDNYADLAEKAAKEDLSYTEYLLHLARAEAQIRRYNQIQRLDLNRLSNSTTSFAIRKTTPPVVVGAGVVGIFSGAGVRAKSKILYATPPTRISVAT